MAKAAATKRKSHTPVMLQYLAAKEQYPDAIIFFRLGDFYEMFFEDALHASEILDIALTSRGSDPEGNKIPMAGVPHHAATGYLSRLLAAGEKVAICEQMADPASVKGVVPRQVVRMVTPGLCLEPDALDARSHNYLVAISEELGLAALELSTAELRLAHFEHELSLIAELVRLEPAEIILPTKREVLATQIREILPKVPLRQSQDLDAKDARAELERLVSAPELQEISSLGSEAGLSAAALALGYAQVSQPEQRIALERIVKHDLADHLVLDETAVRNLELVRTLDGSRKGSLLHLIDHTQTPMGARSLRRRLLMPLSDIAQIRRRHDQVEIFSTDGLLREALTETLRSVADLERLAVRAKLGVATPRDLGAIRDSLLAIQSIRRRLKEHQEQRPLDAIEELLPQEQCDALYKRLKRSLVDEPPAVERQGKIFKPGFHKELDEWRTLASDSREIILKLEQRERERSGIASLKIKYTRVFGYYIEITKSKLEAVPDDYVRKQTVANAERFTTRELAELQDKILHADDKARALELKLFEALRQESAGYCSALCALAQQVAGLDVACCLAHIAERYDYVRPEVDDTLEVELEDSRHPTVERYAAAGEFVPNDISLDVAKQQVIILTGPNMSGKSTVMRQLALSVILAQAGSFVPARKARLGRVDRVFTRVGATDNLARGQSTFMVEMQEAATILRYATRRSLVVLDEIGRGTSTYDGLAIAWAMTEHLHETIGCRTIFATHYHELCRLSDHFERIENHNVAATEHQGGVVFLHKLVPGGADRSYGIQVAELAGVPPLVLARARAVLSELETQGRELLHQKTKSQLALALEQTKPEAHPAVERLQALNLDHMTPVDALVTLAQLKEFATSEDT